MYLYTHMGLVRVRLLGVNASVVPDVVESSLHVSASASILKLASTVNKLLLGEAHQFVIGEEVLAFQGAGLEEDHH